MPAAVDILEQGRRDLELSIADLWLRYFELGGMSSAFELEAVLFGALGATTHNRDIVAVALNERFSELGRNQPIPYSDDADPGDG